MGSKKRKKRKARPKSKSRPKRKLAARGSRPPAHERLRTKLFDFLDSEDGEAIRDTELTGHWLELELPLRWASVSYGIPDEDGRTALDRAVESGRLDAQELAVAREIQEGWVSCFRIENVERDVGFTLMDTLRRKRLHVQERMLTHQAERDGLLVSWIRNRTDHIEFEGAGMYVPPRLAEQFAVLFKEIRDRIPASVGWRTRLAEASLYAGRLLFELWQPPQPDLVTTDGDTWTASTAHYAIHDRARVERELEKLLKKGVDDYLWLEGESVRGVVEVRGKAMVVRCFSKSRLDELRGMLESALGDAVAYRASSFEDPLSDANRDRATADRAPAKRPNVDDPEVKAALHRIVVRQLLQTMDEVIPMFGDTPRRLVKTKQGREQMRRWLERQEEMLQQTMGGVDIGEVWEYLGLQRPTS